MNEHIRADEFGDPSLERVLYERRGPVALLTLNDVNLNGYTYRMFRDFDDCIMKARFDPEVEAIALRHVPDALSIQRLLHRLPASGVVVPGLVDQPDGLGAGDGDLDDVLQKMADPACSGRQAQA